MSDPSYADHLRQRAQAPSNTRDWPMDWPIALPAREIREIAAALEAMAEHDHGPAWGEEPFTLPVTGCPLCEALARLAARARQGQEEPGGQDHPS